MRIDAAGSADVQDLVVLYPAPGVSSGQLPPYLYGAWCDRAQLDRALRNHAGVDWSAAPSGQFEFDDDGACAEVWHLRPQAVRDRDAAGS